MLKHENSNIEIIRKDLWAVRFGLLPMIPQIGCRMDAHSKWVNSPIQFTTDCKTVLLNKDFSLYPLLKQCYPSVIRMKLWRIKRELDKLGEPPLNDPNKGVYWACLKAELTRKKYLNGDDITHDD